MFSWFQFKKSLPWLLILHEEFSATWPGGRVHDGYSERWIFWKMCSREVLARPERRFQNSGVFASWGNDFRTLPTPEWFV